jgi:flagellar motor switch protein FliN
MSTIEDVEIDLAVQLGSVMMPVHQLLRMGRGAVIALDRLEMEDVTLLAHDTPIADAQILVQGERITVTITKMLPLPPERRRSGPGIPRPASEDVAAAMAAEAAADGNLDSGFDAIPAAAPDAMAESEPDGDIDSGFDAIPAGTSEAAPESEPDGDPDGGFDAIPAASPDKPTDPEA